MLHFKHAPGTLQSSNNPNNSQLVHIKGVFYIYIHKKINPPIAKQSVGFFFIFLSAMCQHLGLYMYNLIVLYMYITEHQKELSKKKN